MVDKAELEMDYNAFLASPAKGTFTREVTEIREEVRRGGTPSVRYTRDKYYAAIVDLRTVDEAWDARYCIHARGGKHADKLEVLHTGEKSWSEICDIVGRVYTGNPEDLPLRRVDLACDLLDVTVPHLVRTVAVPYKRIERQYGTIAAEEGGDDSIDFMQVAKRKVETYQLGARPNLFRMYDKTEEMKARYLVAKHRHERSSAELLSNKVLSIADVPTDNAEVNRGFRKRLKNAACNMYPFPSFADWAGVWEWEVRTRVERQLQGTMPLLVSTMGALRSNAVDFNPYEPLIFRPTGTMKINLDEWLPDEYAAGLQYRHWLETGEMSYQQLKVFLGRGRFGKRNGHAPKKLEKYAPFLRGFNGEESGAMSFSGADLFERYRESMRRQLAA